MAPRMHRANSSPVGRVDLIETSDGVGAGVDARLDNRRGSAFCRPNTVLTWRGAGLRHAQPERRHQANLAGARRVELRVMTRSSSGSASKLPVRPTTTRKPASNNPQRCKSGKLANHIVIRDIKSVT
jgi:hypothetical protein